MYLLGYQSADTRRCFVFFYCSYDSVFVHTDKFHPCVIFSRSHSKPTQIDVQHSKRRKLLKCVLIGAIRWQIQEDDLSSLTVVMIVYLSIWTNCTRVLYFQAAIASQPIDTTALSFNFLLQNFKFCLPFQSCPLLVLIRIMQYMLIH